MPPGTRELKYIWSEPKHRKVDDKSSIELSFITCFKVNKLKLKSRESYCCNYCTCIKTLTFMKNSNNIIFVIWPTPDESIGRMSSYRQTLTSNKNMYICLFQCFKCRFLNNMYYFNLLIFDLTYVMVSNNKHVRYEQLFIILYII